MSVPDELSYLYEIRVDKWMTFFINQNYTMITLKRFLFRSVFIFIFFCFQFRQTKKKQKKKSENNVFSL